MCFFWLFVWIQTECCVSWSRFHAYVYWLFLWEKQVSIHFCAMRCIQCKLNLLYCNCKFLLFMTWYESSWSDDCRNLLKHGWEVMYICDISSAWSFWSFFFLWLEQCLAGTWTWDFQIQPWYWDESSLALLFWDLQLSSPLKCGCTSLVLWMTCQPVAFVDASLTWKSQRKT